MFSAHIQLSLWVKLKNKKIVFMHEGTADYSNASFTNYLKEFVKQ